MHIPHQFGSVRLSLDLIGPEVGPAGIAECLSRCTRRPYGEFPTAVTLVVRSRRLKLDTKNDTGDEGTLWTRQPPTLI